MLYLLKIKKSTNGAEHKNEIFIFDKCYVTNLDFQGLHITVKESDFDADLELGTAVPQTFTISTNYDWNESYKATQDLTLQSYATIVDDKTKFLLTRLGDRLVFESPSYKNDFGELEDKQKWHFWKERLKVPGKDLVVDVNYNSSQKHQFSLTSESNAKHPRWVMSGRLQQVFK